MNGFADRLSQAAFTAGMRFTDWHLWGPFQRALADPAAAQASVLARILGANAETAFGRHHRFDRIQGPADYRRAVPVADYESFRPLIMRQAETGEPALTTAPPVFYARTSGTTGEAKLVPVTGAGMHGLATAQRLFACAQYRYADSFAGRVFAIAGAAVEDRTQRGVPIGSATGAVYAAMPSPVRRRYIVPAELFGVDDYDLRDYVLAFLGLAARDVSCMATANPSTFIRLLEVVRGNWDALLDDLKSGHVRGSENLNPQQREALQARIQADPVRARELRRLAVGPGLSFASIWPELRSVVTWTGGSCGYALGALLPQLPPQIRVIEAGYQASECRGTVNIDPLRNICAPALTATFFEFVEREKWEAGGGEFLRIEELEEGRMYHVFVTTLDGLYRYDMKDIVRVTGRLDATPCLEFVQKGRGYTNITGEKLSETQAIASVGRAASAHGLTAPFFLLAADEANAVYRLFLELGEARAAPSIGAAVDRTLMEMNIEYSAKRRGGRLGALACVVLRPGTGAAYRRHCVRRGQRDAQFKIQHLQYARNLEFDLAKYTVRVPGQTVRPATRFDRRGLV
ncbi:MAG: GH3 auxin-responsive promoter family protein [Proteobacteria bacterium]|nr:GH3 auxin-responsive promoter family protein [Pseudomonadota bacterium]